MGNEHSKRNKQKKAQPKAQPSQPIASLVSFPLSQPSPATPQHEEDDVAKVLFNKCAKSLLFLLDSEFTDAALFL
jgi:hypothetical protein